MTASGGKPTALFKIYRGATAVIEPFAWRKVSRKLASFGVPEARQRERLGHATQPRPDGKLIWFHAASVGESLSVLTLITRLGERLSDAQFLITSGTATSAELIAKRLPPRTRHQFAPLDSAGPVDRFLSHWQPNAAIFVESELWPQMLVSARNAGAKLVLLNARLSQKSVDGWRKWPGTAHYILDQFDLFVTQNQQTAENLRAMGADPERIQPGTNLKAMSAPLPVDEDALKQIREALGSRPIWIASSTHDGEEETVLSAHKDLLARHKDLCLLLIPRHPERGDRVETLVSDAGLSCARRSRRELPNSKTQVYLADTLGETGTWYALCPLVFLGGSLKEIGGHNPFEPAQCGAAVITGPGYFNFAETFKPLIATGGAIEVTDAPGLAAAVARWLENADTFDKARKAAGACVAAQQSALDGVVETLCTRLDLG
ncbi:3-deoxy-D-manno-octulosonic acid transferase [Primorskyibacter sp. S87]|uniref:3-deoxy-D-manno-octulosonic acid transferase n=1 Tax=Primorskyibacter sp. S87 TaxID=3415126 RepID=UPI003C7DE6CF